MGQDQICMPFLPVQVILDVANNLFGLCVLPDLLLVTCRELAQTHEARRFPPREVHLLLLAKCLSGHCNSTRACISVQ